MLIKKDKKLLLMQEGVFLLKTEREKLDSQDLNIYFYLLFNSFMQWMLIF